MILGAAITTPSANAILSWDLRARVSGGGAAMENPKSVILLPGLPAQTIDFDLYAVVTGLNATIDETFQQGLTKLLTTGAIRGNFELIVLNPTFAVVGSLPGPLVDLDADGDIDIGSNSTTATTGYIFPRASAQQGAGVGVDLPGATAGREFLWGTVRLNISNVTPADTQTAANFAVPSGLTGANAAARGTWNQDAGAAENGSNSALLSVGAPVLLTVVPEPSAFGMVLLGAMGLVGFRRLGIRRA